MITGEQLREAYKTLKSCGCLGRDLIYLSKSEINLNSGYLYQQIAFNNLVRERDGELCQKCDKTQEQEFDIRNEKLHTHHKDFNKSNNKPENVITLCCSCHLKLHGRPPEFHCVQHSKSYKYSKMELRDEELLQLALDVAYT